MPAHNTPLIGFVSWITMCVTIWMTLVPRTIEPRIFLFGAGLLLVIGIAVLLVWRLTPSAIRVRCVVR